jgi:hypothetical protein
MRNIKQIRLVVTLSGNGVVQYDGKDAKFAHNCCVNAPIHARNDNNAFAKAVYSQVADPVRKDDGKVTDAGTLKKTIKISADGLRHAIHIVEHPFQNPNVGLSAYSRVAFIANPGTLLRGYMFAGANLTIRKKSGYALTSAREISKAAPIMEFFSRSGKKEEKANKGADNETGDTSLHSRETVGDTRYQFELIIDPAELGFLSMDDLQDRRAILDADKELFRAALAKNLGLAEIPDASYFIKKGSAYVVPERGILLPQSAVKTMVLDLIRKVAAIHITKSQSGYAKTESIQCFLIDAPIDNPKGTSFSIMEKDGTFDTSALDAALEGFQEVYVEETITKAVEMRAVVDAEVAAAKKASSDKKAEKKAEKKEAKEKAKAAKSSAQTQE